MYAYIKETKNRGQKTNFKPYSLDSTDTADFTYFMGYSESTLWTRKPAV